MGLIDIVGDGRLDGVRHHRSDMCASSCGVESKQRSRFSSATFLE
jgi:hypothetical protein